MQQYSSFLQTHVSSATPSSANRSQNIILLLRDELRDLGGETHVTQHSPEMRDIVFDTEFLLITSATLFSVQRSVGVVHSECSLHEYLHQCLTLLP